MEVYAVVVGRLQVGVALRDILRIRHIVDILQVADIGIPSVGVDKDTDGILGVERHITHHKVGHMVEVTLDVLALNQAVECRVLVVDIRNKGVALLRVAEAGAYTVLDATAVGHRR